MDFFVLFQWWGIVRNETWMKESGGVGLKIKVFKMSVKLGSWQKVIWAHVVEIKAQKQSEASTGTGCTKCFLMWKTMKKMFIKWQIPLQFSMLWKLWKIQSFLVISLFQLFTNSGDFEFLCNFQIIENCKGICHFTDIFLIVFCIRKSFCAPCLQRILGWSTRNCCTYYEMVSLQKSRLVDTLWTVVWKNTRCFLFSGVWLLCMGSLRT